MGVARSQNGWPVILSDSGTRLRKWTVPADTGAFEVSLQAHRAGFVLAHYALAHAELIETVAGRGDDFGWSPRKIAGSDEWSNHASGTAVDLNASAHPQGAHTFSEDQRDLVHDLLTHYRGAVRWGGDYRTTVDEMHFEIAVDSTTLLDTARRLARTRRGRRLVEANPGLGKWVR